MKDGRQQMHWLFTVSKDKIDEIVLDMLEVKSVESDTVAG